MTDFAIEWVVSFIAITTSTFRSFNLGYQGESYILSILTYIVFMIYAEKKSQKILNLFYIFTAIIGAYRHGFSYDFSYVKMDYILPFLILSALSLSIFIIKTSKKIVKINRKKNN